MMLGVFIRYCSARIREISRIVFLLRYYIYYGIRAFYYGRALDFCIVNYLFFISYNFVKILLRKYSELFINSYLGMDAKELTLIEHVLLELLINYLSILFVGTIKTDGKKENINKYKNFINQGVIIVRNLVIKIFYKFIISIIGSLFIKK